MSAVNMDQKLFAELLEGDRPVLVDFWAPGAATAAGSAPL